VGALGVNPKSSGGVGIYPVDEEEDKFEVEVDII
jgi:hypothetical protein